MAALSNEDIDTLIEALDAVAQADHFEHMAKSLINALTEPTREKAAARIEREQREFDDARGERKLRDEQHTVLKARLIAMRPPVFTPEKV